VRAHLVTATPRGSGWRTPPWGASGFPPRRPAAAASAPSATQRATRRAIEPPTLHRPRCGRLRCRGRTRAPLRTRRGCAYATQEERADAAGGRRGPVPSARGGCARGTVHSDVSDVCTRRCEKTGCSLGFHEGHEFDIMQGHTCTSIWLGWLGRRKQAAEPAPAPHPTTIIGAVIRSSCDSRELSIFAFHKMFSFFVLFDSFYIHRRSRHY
jgi:hypothetical protein